MPPLQLVMAFLLGLDPLCSFLDLERYQQEGYRSAGPPLTKGTWNQHDVNKILNNSQSRHDINFGLDLHLRSDDV
jgi:hypothetical protein